MSEESKYRVYILYTNGTEDMIYSDTLESITDLYNETRIDTNVKYSCIYFKQYVLFESMDKKYM